MILKTRHYIYTIVTATLISVAVWLCMPKEYSATTTIIDEYKEMDLGIGTNDIQASIKRALKQDNTGINDIEVYCKILKTEDFARKLSNKKLKDGITYGKHVICTKHWWQSGKDTIGIISDKINYNLRTKKAMLTIELKDSDPSIAALMLDSLVNELQCFINKSHQKKTSAALAEAQNKYELAEKEYNAAQSAYINYADSNSNAQDQFKITKAKELKKNLQAKYDTYQEVLERCIREDALLKREHYSFTTVKAIVVPTNDNSHPLAYIIILNIFAFLMLKAVELFLKRKSEKVSFEFGDIFSPWAITVEVWIGVFLLYYLSSPTLYKPSEQFYVSLLIWIPVFVFTSFITFNLLEHNSEPITVETFCLNKNAFNLILILSLLLSPVLLYNVYKIVSLFDTEDTLSNIRTLAVNGEGNGILSLASVFSQVSFIVGICAYPKTRVWMIIASTVCCFLCSIAIMEKGIIITMFLCSSYVLYERKAMSLRGLTLSCLIVLVLMFLFNIFRAGTDSDYSKQTTMLDFISMYILSPIPAYCTVLHDVSQQFGVNTFAVIYDYLNRFGFGPFEVHEKLQEFVFVPIPTNVYTIFQPFYRDFGYWGIAVFAAIYGIIMGMTYRYSKKGCSFFTCLYTYFFSLIVLQFYQENLFLTLSFNFQFSLLLLLCTQNFVKLRI